ncbi:MAG: hypothetical protein BWY32_03662 [bacterium ADurb.Bin243]|nr:MAG: hypothetical protein BWY32_03662 [bacterium ADurb.Bin243]
MPEKIKSLLSDFKNSAGDLSYFIYILKCVSGASICYALYKFFPDHQFSWSIVSVLLVIAPESADSVRLACDRMKANILGASVGMSVFIVHTPEFISLCIAVAATILLATFIKLGGASRSALAALVIVLIQENEKNTWRSALERMGCVVSGCVVGLLVTVVFFKLENYIRYKIKSTEARLAPANSPTEPDSGE